MSVALVLGVLGLFSGVQSQTPVQLDVYYESMCPDSALFFREQLESAQQKIPSYLNIELFPYGNARYRGQHDEYTFTCQHGPNECYGNMVQTCFIELINNTDTRIKFINCAFNERDQKKSLENCISDLDLRRQVKKCVTGPLGRNLEYEVAKKTESLNPRHSFIPWITVNGKGGSILNDKANENLLSVVCDEISSFQNLNNAWLGSVFMPAGRNERRSRAVTYEGSAVTNFRYDPFKRHATYFEDPILKTLHVKTSF